MYKNETDLNNYDKLITKNGDNIMHKIINKIHKMIFCLAVVISGICVNTTCSWKLYQEEIPMELHKFKKYE